MKNLMTLVNSLVILSFTWMGVSAQVLSPVDSLSSAFAEETEEMKEEFRDYAAKALEDYRQYSIQAKAEFSSYLDNIKSVWGGNTSVLTDTPYEWVEYSDDFENRSVVDFKAGKIYVSVKVGKDESVDPALLDKKLAEAVARVLTSRGSTCPYPSSVDVSEALTEKPVLDGLVDLSAYDTGTASVPVPAVSAPPSPSVKSRRLDLNSSGARKTDAADSLGKTMASRVLQEERDREKAVSSVAPGQDIAELAASIVSQSEKQFSEGTGESGLVVTVEMDMVTDNLSRNAVLYKDLVMEFSGTFNVEPALVFAVIEQESMFNPQAASWVPAYGLMQLVPASGGLDAYRYVYGKEWVPTRSYLFVPRNNIELGTAYLRVLMDQFSSVEDLDCRRLCVIASYNTGAGNVSRSFTGSSSLVRSIPYINAFDYEGLYEHLTHNLGAEEARNYVSGVSERRNRYLGK